MATLRLSPFHPSGCKGTEAQCQAMVRALKAAARASKPPGYTWNWWHSQTGKPRVIQTGPIRDWRYPSPAYKDGRAWAGVDRASYEACIEEWEQGTHPWTRRTPVASETPVAQLVSVVIRARRKDDGTYGTA